MSAHPTKLAVGKSVRRLTGTRRGSGWNRGVIRLSAEGVVAPAAGVRMRNRGARALLLQARRSFGRVLNRKSRCEVEEQQNVEELLL